MRTCPMDNEQGISSASPPLNFQPSTLNLLNWSTPPVTVRRERSWATETPKVQEKTTEPASPMTSSLILAFQSFSFSPFVRGEDGETKEVTLAIVGPLPRMIPFSTL